MEPGPGSGEERLCFSGFERGIGDRLRGSLSQDGGGGKVAGRGVGKEAGGGHWFVVDYF
jgi:hypothetical protein